jgi:4-aminobutyrate aminotransferase-like enzyme
VVVVESTMASPVFVTAEAALALGKTVMAVPGSVFSPLSVGCHQLLRDGAGPERRRTRIVGNGPAVGSRRGLGQMVGLVGGVELVRDRATRASFDPSAGVGRRVMVAAMEQGVLFRALGGDVLAISPPLVIAEDELMRVVDTIDRAIGQVAAEL